MSEHDYKECVKGHFYTEEECPFCPKSEDNTKLENDGTEMLGSGDDTIKNETKEMSSDKTEIFGLNNQSNQDTVSTEKEFNPDRTIITGISDDNIEGSSDNIQRRKLKGWLVSFDIEEFGMDYRIIEGRNTIGSRSSNDITVKDHEVSGKHALILSKKDSFILSDEMSSNGTFLNGEDLVPRETYSLKDGDEIKIGQTNFLFKTAFKTKK